MQNLIEIELFDHLLCVNKRQIFKWIVSDTKYYLELFNLIDLCLQSIYI